jgi:glycosyltransferase involved in cell wall biosynthesis
LFDPGRPDALAKLLLDVDTSPDKYDEFGRNARATYESKHDTRRNIEQLLDIYRFAIGHSVSVRR